MTIIATAGLLWIIAMLLGWSFCRASAQRDLQESAELSRLRTTGRRKEAAGKTAA